MTALPCADQLRLNAEPVPFMKCGTKPKASLLLMLRALSNEELADLEDEIALYVNAGVVCQRLSTFLEP